MKYFLLTLALLLPRGMAGQAAGAAEKFTERTSTYFVERYGPPKSSNNVGERAFIRVKRGAVTVKGQFNVREFRSGDLIVHAVFFVPSLKLAGVHFQLPRAWTKEQIDAVLKAYPADWKNAADNAFTKIWTSPDGARAIGSNTSFEIQSPAIAAAVERSVEEWDAKNKAVPKF